MLPIVNFEIRYATPDLDIEEAVDDLAMVNADLLIMNGAYAVNNGPDIPFTLANITEIRNGPGVDFVFGYMSIGAVDMNLDRWNADFARFEIAGASGGTERFVEFWAPGIIESYKTWIKDLHSQGFDGAFLDVLDTYVTARGTFRDVIQAALISDFGLDRNAEPDDLREVYIQATTTLLTIIRDLDQFIKTDPSIAGNFKLILGNNVALIAHHYFPSADRNSVANDTLVAAARTATSAILLESIDFTDTRPDTLTSYVNKVVNDPLLGFGTATRLSVSYFPAEGVFENGEAETRAAQSLLAAADLSGFIGYASAFSNPPGTFDREFMVVNRSSDGPDTLISRGSGALDGGAGDDLIIGRTAADTLIGGSGEDRLTGGGNRDVLVGGTGGDQLFGEEGDDLLGGQDGSDYIAGGSGADTLLGEGGDDTLVAGTGADILAGGSGADLMGGQDADDQLFGEAGDDTLFGEAGNDVLVGGSDRDRQYGGIGDDLIGGQDGDDYLEGGDGSDTLLGEPGRDTLVGGSGDDRLYGQADDDRIGGQEGADFLDGGEGCDVLLGEGGRDVLVGGSGDDQMFGHVGDDLLGGQDGDDLIDGGEGADGLLGEGGRDRLIGGAGNDGLYGLAEADRLEGGAGDDYLVGGSGGDLFAFGAGAGADRLADFDRAGGDRFDLLGGRFSALSRADVDGDGRVDSILIHAGGQVVALGVADLTLDGWNALVI